jgi:site-specific DNA recombinase
MGELVARGEWPPILEQEATEKLRLMLSDPARRTGGRPGRATYLLSGGLARCGRCGAPLAGHHDKIRQTRRYVCVNQPGLNRCGRLTIAADALDGITVAALLNALSGTNTASSFIPAETKSRELAEIASLRQSLDDLARLYGEGKITQKEWLAARGGLTERLDLMQASVRTQARRLIVQGLPQEELKRREHWDSLSLEQQRSIAEAVLRSVVVAPARKGGNRVDPSRITLNWQA